MTRPHQVVVLSHLYPNDARPGSGPFVADEITVTSRRFDVGVVAPVRWLPPVGPAAWARERRVPALELRGGVEILRPRVPALPFGGMAAESLLWLRRLRPILRRVARPGGVVHGHFGIPDGFVATRVARELGARSVVTLWGSDLLVFRRTRALRRLLRATLAAADRVVVVSAPMAAVARELGVPDAKIAVAPGGVPAPARPIDRDAVRKTLGFAPHERWIAWIGGLVPVKRPEVALDAFAAVAQEDPAARLVIVGDGPLRSAVDRAVAERGLGGRVRLTGHLRREDVAALLHAADVASNSSASEGTPLALTEALVAGTPVAAVPVGGVPDLVEAVDGGTIAADGDPRSLAEAIRLELARGRDRSAVAGRAARYALEHTTRPIVAIYEELLGA